MDKIDFMVSVWCPTYNHSNYIINTFDGFCMQSTDFPFVCVIADDASTDGEQEVIKNYLNEHFDLEDRRVVRQEETDDYVLTFARHKTNLSCYFAVLFLKYNHYCIKKSKSPYIAEWNNNAKYIALCEGDDYWTDSLKLQKTVSYLESHPEYVMCFHAYNKIWGNDFSTSVECHNFDYDNDNVDLSYFLNPTVFVATLSLVYLREITEEFPVWAQIAPVGDVPLQLVLSSRGKIVYIDDVMGCYRMNSSATSFTSRSQNSLCFFYKYMIRMIRMHKSFDKWSGYKYHDAIKSKVKLEYKKIIKRTFSEIKKIIKRALHYKK